MKPILISLMFSFFLVLPLSGCGNDEDKQAKKDAEEIQAQLKQGEKDREEYQKMLKSKEVNTPREPVWPAGYEKANKQEK